MKRVGSGSLLSSGIEEEQPGLPSQNQLGAHSASSNSPEVQGRFLARTCLLLTALISLLSTSTIERVHADPPPPTASIPCSVPRDSTNDNLGYKPIIFISSDSGQAAMVRTNSNTTRVEMIDGHRVFMSRDTRTVLAERGTISENEDPRTTPCNQCGVLKLALPSRIQTVRRSHPGQVCQGNWTPARPIRFDEYTVWLGHPVGERDRLFCQPTPLITGTSDGARDGQDAECAGLNEALTTALNQVENPSQRPPQASDDGEPESSGERGRRPATQATPAPTRPAAGQDRPPAAQNARSGDDTEAETAPASQNSDTASAGRNSQLQVSGQAEPSMSGQSRPSSAGSSELPPPSEAGIPSGGPENPPSKSDTQSAGGSPTSPTPANQIAGAQTGSNSPPPSGTTATNPVGSVTSPAANEEAARVAGGGEQNPATATPPATGDSPATPPAHAETSGGGDGGSSEPDTETGMGNCNLAASISEKYSCESQRNTARALRTVRKVTDEGVVTTVEAVSNAAKARIEEARNATRDGATRENTIALKDAYSSAADVYTASASVKAAAGATETTIGIIQLAQALEQGKQADEIQSSTDDEVTDVTSKVAPAISSGEGENTVKSVVLSFEAHSEQSNAILSKLEMSDVQGLTATSFTYKNGTLEVTVPEDQSDKARKAIISAVRRTGRAAADQKRAEAGHLITEGTGALSKGIGYGIQSGLEFASAAAMRSSAAGLTMTPNTSGVAITTGMDPLRMDINMPGAATASIGGTGGSVVGSGQTVSNAEANQNSASTDPNNPINTPPGGFGVAGNGQDQTGPTPTPAQPREFASGGNIEGGGGGGVSSSSAVGGPPGGLDGSNFNGGMGGGGAPFANNGPQPPYQDPYAVQPGASPGPNEGYSVNAAQGGGRGGGRGSSSNEISDLLGKFMNANKSPDGTPQSPGSANFAGAGAGRQIAHQWSPLGPNADLFNRVHETYQSRMRDGRLR